MNSHRLREMHTALRNENAILKEQLDWLKNRFSAGRPNRPPSSYMTVRSFQCFRKKRRKLFLFPKKTITVPEHQLKAKHMHDEWMRNLPVKEVRHEEDHPVCEKCGA